MLKKPDERSENEISQEHDSQHRQTEKPEEPAGLPFGVGFLFKKVHRLLLPCNKKLSFEKYFYRSKLRKNPVGVFQRLLRADVKPESRHAPGEDRRAWIK